MRTELAIREFIASRIAANLSPATIEWYKDRLLPLAKSCPTLPHRPEPMVTPQYIEQTKQSFALLRELVRDVLVRDRDYGRVPGMGDFLWDPGASQIIGSFNCCQSAKWDTF